MLNESPKTQQQPATRARRDSKLKIVRIDSPNSRDSVTFGFSRPLTDLELQGLGTIVRQAIAG